MKQKLPKRFDRRLRLMTFDQIWYDCVQCAIIIIIIIILEFPVSEFISFKIVMFCFVNGDSQ